MVDQERLAIVRQILDEAIERFDSREDALAFATERGVTAHEMDSAAAALAEDNSARLAFRNAWEALQAMVMPYVSGEAATIDDAISRMPPEEAAATKQLLTVAGRLAVETGQAITTSAAARMLAAGELVIDPSRVDTFTLYRDPDV